MDWVIVIGLFIILSIPAYLIFGNLPVGAMEEPVSLANLSSILKLEGSNAWEVVILRRSGYTHDAWQYTGSSAGALQTATQKMRQANLNEFMIVYNSDSKFEARAYYESTGTRRTGKYIGGFQITRASSQTD